MRFGRTITAFGAVAVYLAGLVTYAAVDPWKSSTTTTRAASPQSAATIVPSSSDARRSGVEVANLPAVVGPSADAQSPEAQRLAALGGYLNAFWSDQFAVPIYAGHVWRPVTTLFVNTDSTACDGANALKFQDFFCPSEYFVELAVPRAIPGAATPARNFIIAHEWGHAVQESANVQASDKLMELQADCFAGAFLKHASEAGILTGGDINLGAIREAIRTVGDDVTTDFVPGSEHGTGAERLAHFDTGWNATAQACV